MSEKKKYKYRLFCGDIEKVEFIKETNCFIVLPNGRKDSKKSTHVSYHQTPQAAKEHLIRKREMEVKDLEGKLEYVKENLKKAIDLEITHIL